MESEGKHYNHALALLAGRDYSRQKLTHKLRQKGCPAKEVERILACLSSKGYWDEGRYACAQMAKWLRKGDAPAYVRLRLRQEGFDVSLGEVEEVAAELGLSIEGQLRKLRQKKATLSADKFTRYALSRGHNFGDIQQCL